MLRVALFLLTNFAILILISMSARVLGLSPHSGDYQALLIFSAIAGFGGSLISLFMSKYLVKASMNVKTIENPSNEVEVWLIQTVKELSKKAGIDMPEVGIYHGSANAFATGWNKNSALVAVSDGLLQGMSKDEVEGVLAHEISHASNGDMVTLTLVQGVVNTFVIFFSEIIGRFIDKAVFKNERGRGVGYYVGTFVAQILLSILATMVVMWFSRYREFKADKGGANLAGKEKMISALVRLQSMHTQALPDKLAAFGISGSKVMEFFSSHPPLEKRIEALRNLN